MNLPLSMLVDYMNINLDEIDPREYGEKLTMIGQKVEVVEEVAKDIKKVVVGKIEEIEKHPDADKLVVCQINVGDEILQIVTGATNVFVGALVPVALHGSVLAGGLKIKKGKLRGVTSNGMLCSIEELGFSNNEYPEASEDGIYIFQDDTLELGSCVKKALMLEETVVEFEITSNRPDCFSVIGLARETAAAYDLDFKVNKPTFSTVKDLHTKDFVNVKMEDDNCYRYKCAVVKNAKMVETPLWLRHRLISGGIRPINVFVDITNYILMEYGQPMHAFDLSLVEGSEIIIRKANEGEKIVSLDDEERNIPKDTMLIADKNKAIAIAGIIGGNNTKINEDTNTVLFECANFDGTNIRLSSKKLGLRTDSSTKFEKGLDPNNIDAALNRALQLVEQLGCGEISETYVDVYPNKCEQNKVSFTYEGINKIIGTNLSKEEIDAHLAKFEIEVKDGMAIVPTFRPDLEIQADLAEEVARSYGYDKIKPILATGTPTVGRLTYEQQVQRDFERELSSLGVSEIKTFSFESPKVFNKLNLNADDKLRNVITINNPLGEDFSAMRTTLLNGLLTSISTNYNNRNDDVLFYEIGKIYLADKLPLETLPEERRILSIGGYGQVDFYEIKGIVEHLFEKFGVKNIEFVRENELNFMHPTKTAKVLLNGENIGFIGEVHPTVAKNYSLGKNTYVAELNLDKIIYDVDRTIIYKELPKFPASKRDISMIVDKGLEVQKIENCIKAGANDIVESINLFDVFTGEQVGEGNKSVAYNITFRSSERTLTEEEINSVMQNILESLEKGLGINLRK